MVGLTLSRRNSRDCCQINDNLSFTSDKGATSNTRRGRGRELELESAAKTNWSWD